MCKGTTITFRLGDMWFEYDEEKNRGNIKKHGISLRSQQRILKGGYIMVNTNDYTKELLKELAFTEEEKKELELAREMPIVFDEDSPETTPERALKFRRVNPPRRTLKTN